MGDLLRTIARWNQQSEDWLARRAGLNWLRRSRLRLRTKQNVISLLCYAVTAGAISTVYLRVVHSSKYAAMPPETQQTLHEAVFAVAFGAAAAFVFQAALDALLIRVLFRAVEQLGEAVKIVGGGDLSHRVARSSGDEVGDLEEAFNGMTRALQGSFDHLRRTADSFERFVPRNFLQVIAPAGIENIQVGTSVKRTLTILFCDIRGYTTMSERMTAEETFAFVNAYLGRMGAAIHGAGGFIDKYIGDAIMALFEDTDGALAAAGAMGAALEEFNRERGGAPIEIGIGIHRGEVVMGTVGFVSRIDSTVIGDAVNVAARVESLTKQYQARLLLTQSALDSLAKPRPAKQLGTVTMKGKTQAIAIYSL